MKIFKNKEGKQIFLSALLLVIIIALYIEFNVIISKINFKDIDITEAKVYSLSTEAIEKINSIEKDVYITLYDFEKYSDYTYTSDTVYILNQIDEMSEKIHIDLNEDTNNENKIPYMIFSCEDKTRKVMLNELVTYNYSTKYGFQDESYYIEPMIINSIINVESTNDKKIYIYLDKSIYNEKMFTSFINIAGMMGFDSYSLDLTEDNEIPEDCAFIVIPPLASVNENGTIEALDFSDEERDKIENYISKGGNILFLQESKSVVSGETSNLDYIMELYGVSISDGIVFQDEKIISDFPSYIYTNVNLNNDIFRMVNSNSAICVFDSGIINIEDNSEQDRLNVKQNILIKTNSNAFLRKNLLNNNYSKSEDDESIDGAAIGVYAEKNIGENKSKAIVFSSSIFSSNNPIYIKDVWTNKKLAVEAVLVDENQDIIIDSISALAEPDDHIFYKKSKFNVIPAKGIISDGITLKIIFGIPMFVLFIGYIIWRYRKNKI